LSFLIFDLFQNIGRMHHQNFRLLQKIFHLFQNNCRRAKKSGGGDKSTSVHRK